jgi:hypothetical protein
MFSGLVIEIFFDKNKGFNQTHAIYWLNRAKIKYYKMKIDKNFIIFSITKLPKDTTVKYTDYKGEDGILYTYL